MKITTKFESIYPHPAYSQNRLVVIKDDPLQLGQIIEYDEYRYKIRVAEED